MRRGRLIPGFDHFPEEEIRMSHCIRALDAIENSNINVMVSHDVPESAIQNILRSPPLADQSRGILERLFTAAAPRLVVSGHHHRHRMFEHRDASFVSLRNIDCFHFEIVQADRYTDLIGIANECCLIGDNLGRTYEI